MPYTFLKPINEKSIPTDSGPINKSTQLEYKIHQNKFLKTMIVNLQIHIKEFLYFKSE